MTEVTDSVWSSWLVMVVDHGIMTLCHSLVTMGTVSLGVKAFDNDPDADGCWLPSCYSTQKNLSNYVSLFGGIIGYTSMSGLLAIS